MNGDEDEDALVWTHGIDLVWEENIVENDDGTIGIEGLILEERRKRRLKGTRRDVGSYKRGMIRHTFVILDLSEAMDDNDLKPSRLGVAVNALVRFVDDFFHHNPISDMGLIVMREGIAHTITDLIGNKDTLISYIRSLGDPKSKYFPAGEVSLQNALELACNLLKGIPSHATKEVVMLMSSLSSCDPGNIFDTVDRLAREHVIVNVVALAAAVRVCEDVCQRTKGIHSVALDERHVTELMLEFSTPPLATDNLKSTQLPVGFATYDSTNPITRRRGKKIVTIVSGYLCPQCGNKVANIPSKCDVCDLILVSSPHLAKTYHHLFPLPAFVEVPLTNKTGEKESGKGNGNNMDMGADESDNKGETRIDAVSGMADGLNNNNNNDKSNLSSVCAGCEDIMEEDTHAYQCPKCEGVFCFACDLFCHEEMFNCPQCVVLRNQLQNQ
eukprot:m.82985 g.82985  ORF g.82985 m.82985 type:complete len:442 (+) comp12107_c0_seq6:82-1407(+)